MTTREAAEVGQADLASLARASGLALRPYRQAHVSACVARALARHGTRSVAGLARLCQSGPAVRATLRRCILVPVTGLFRDPVLVLQRLGALASSRLLGSDLSAGRVELARRGAMVPATVRREARPALRWERRDLLREPPPPGAFDLVLCRNVTIYFEPSAQRAVYVKLAAALRPGGVLMLGTCERLLTPGQFGLAPVGPHLYRRVAA